MSLTVCLLAVRGRRCFWIRGRRANTHCFSIARYGLDTQATHPAVQLRAQLVTRVACHARQSAAVHSHHAPLHIY